jgi:hypothetical protein
MFLLYMYRYLIYILYINLRIVHKLILKHRASKKRNVSMPNNVSFSNCKHQRTKTDKSLMLMICIVSSWTCSHTSLIDGWCRLFFASSSNGMLPKPRGNFADGCRSLNAGCRCLYVHPAILLSSRHPFQLCMQWLMYSGLINCFLNIQPHSCTSCCVIILLRCTMGFSCSVALWLQKQWQHAKTIKWRYHSCGSWKQPLWLGVFFKLWNCFIF